MGDESRFRYRRDEGAAEAAARARSAPSSAGANDPDDPLAELARMIGEQDPFDDFSGLEPEPAPQIPAPQIPARQAPARQAATHQAAAHQAPAPQRYAAPSAPAYPDPRQVARAPARPAPAAVQPAYYDDEEEEDDIGEESASGWSSQSYSDAPARAAEAPRYASAPARTAPAPASYAASRGRTAPPYGGQQDATVRVGYGSLARQLPARAAPAGSRSVADEDDDDYEDDAHARAVARAYAPSAARQASAYDERAYDERSYDDRSYDRRAPAGHGQDAHGQGANGYAAEDEAAYAYSAARRDDDAYDDYDDTYDPEYADEGYMPPHGEDVYDQEPRRRKGRMALLLGVSALGLLVAGVAGVFAYNMAVGRPGGMSSSGAPPVIRADASPAKTASPAPAAADGQQKLIYDRVGGSATAANERVVPREEQPVDVTAAVSRTATYAPADPAAAQPGALPSTPGSVSVAANPSLTEPKKVRTLSVRADGTVAPGGPGSSISAYAATPMPAAPVLPDPAALPGVAAPAQTATASPAPAQAGSYVVQVASQRSEADAMGSWKVLQQRYPNLLGSYKATVKKADLGDKGIYYRAQVGPFASRDQANELCQSLRAQGGDCVITKN